jgi:hypothetical protein
MLRLDLQPACIRSHAPGYIRAWFVQQFGTPHHSWGSVSCRAPRSVHDDLGIIQVPMSE